jgi:hypothetical protein
MWGKVLAIGAAVGLAVGGWYYKTHIALDSDLPADIKARVMNELATDDDPVKLEAFADTLQAYPKAQAALRKKAAGIRSHMLKANPVPSSGPSGGETAPSGNNTQNAGPEAGNAKQCPDGYGLDSSGNCVPFNTNSADGNIPIVRPGYGLVPTNGDPNSGSPNQGSLPTATPGSASGDNLGAVND